MLQCKITFLSEFHDYTTVKRDLKHNFQRPSEHTSCFCTISPVELEDDCQLTYDEYLPFTPVKAIKNMEFAHLEFEFEDEDDDQSDSDYFLNNSLFYYDDKLDCWICKVIASLTCDMFYFVKID